MEMMSRMKKIILAAAMIMATIFVSAAGASADYMMLEYDGGTHMYNGEVFSLVVNNQLLEPPLEPIIFNDRALVPVREIFEEVGATVNYDNSSQTVEVVGEDTYVTLTINDNVAYINGKRTNIPDNVVPKLISKVGGETKTMVPVRFISESIGLDVEFNSDDRAILIDSDGYTLDDEAEPEYYEEEYYEEEAYTEDEPVYLTDIRYSTSGKKNASITVTTDKEIGDYRDFVLSSPERLVVDITDGKLDGVPENIEVNAAGISTIRLGDNDERARIVVDISNLKKYSVKQTSDNTIEITTVIKSPTTTESTQTSKTSNEASSAVAHASSEKLIVLDAGHGGSDSGAVGYLNGNAILEKNLTLEITNRVKDILEGAGYTVSLTRDDDSLPSLSERPAQANAENAAVFVSIHINAVDNAPNANGTEVYFAESNNDDGYGTTSEQLAHNILDRMLYYMHSTNRGVKSAEHAVTRRCNMPAALAEVGFITNATEVYNMTTDEYQQKAAQGIAEGIMITLWDITVPE